MKKDESPIQEMKPLALDANALAKTLGVSLRHIRRADAAGQLPRAVLIGGRAKRWVTTEIEEWLSAGCPRRREWEERRSMTEKYPIRSESGN